MLKIQSNSSAQNIQAYSKYYKTKSFEALRWAESEQKREVYCDGFS